MMLVLPTLLALVVLVLLIRALINVGSWHD